MSKWSKSKAALLAAALLPALQFASCVADLVQDTLIATLFE